MLFPKTEYETHKNDKLNNCKICGHIVRLVAMSPSFYIKCDFCNTSTRLFFSTKELINLWNENEK